MDPDFLPPKPFHRPARAWLTLLISAAVLKLVSPAAGQTTSVATNSVGGDAALTNSLLNDFTIPLWGDLVTVRQSFGFKDNLILSEENPAGAAFSTSGGDLIIYRLPANGWMFNLFLSADETHYIDASENHDEQAVFAVSQWTRIFNDQWRAGLGANYGFQNQVLDLTATETNGFMIGKVVGHNFNDRVFARREFGTNWIEAEVSGARQFLNEPLDGYWQCGPKVALGHHYGGNSELTLGYQWLDVLYDSRPQIDPNGDPISGTHLRFQSQLVELNWHQYWDNDQHWNTQSQLGCEKNTDNGSRYFSFSQFRLLEKLEYADAAWKFSGRFRVGYFDYPVQTIDPGSAILTSRYQLSAGLHAEKRLSKAFGLFADYIYDRSFSNVPDDSYQANTVSAGIDWRF